jgi:hypothetical protein
MMKRILFGWAMSIGLSVLALPTHAAELRIVSWNIEGGGFEDAEVATITANMDRLGHADIWGLCQRVLRTFGGSREIPLAGYFCGYC